MSRSAQQSSQTPLSVLDQSPIPEGSTAADALANSTRLARATEQFGYHRYWVAEHHNSGGLAGSSPEILIGHIAANTTTIRVGSAGVMLSHYSPLKVAENFRVLEALHPGRIDLGLGRAPGSDPITARALAQNGDPIGVEYYPSMVEEVQQFLNDDVPADSPVFNVRARPETAGVPEMWLLASSQDSVALAAHLGLPIGWAHFINPTGAELLHAYRAQYQASLEFPKPWVAVATAVICAETTEEAEHLASSIHAWRARGVGGKIPPPGSAAEPRSPLSVSTVQQQPKPLIVGNPAEVTKQLEELVDEFAADELVVVTITHGHDARVRSYELLAEAWNGRND